MGQPAARGALKDKGAHHGLIITGSIDVIIGGRPAARQGDTILCSSHGPASIAGGSLTVFINGKPAARMGDKTSCGTPPEPSTKGPTKVHSFGGSLLDMQSEGHLGLGNVAGIDASGGLTVGKVYGNVDDITGNGIPDQISYGGALVEGNHNIDFNIGGISIGGVYGDVSIGRMDVIGGAYASNGVNGYEGSASGSLLSGDNGFSIGDERFLRISKGTSTDISYIEANAKNMMYTGGSEHKYGISAGTPGMSVGAARSSPYTEIVLLGGAIKLRTRKGMEASYGIPDGPGAELDAWVDTDDYTGKLKVDISGIPVPIPELSEFLSMGGGIDVSFDAKPLVGLANKPNKKGAPTVIIGEISTGCPTVLIG